MRQLYKRITALVLLFALIVEACDQTSENAEYRLTLKFKNYTSVPVVRECVEFLDLSNNYISYIAEYSFQPLRNLTDLILVNNDIHKINVRAFKRLPSLKNVDLSVNNLTFLHPYTFFHNKNLEKLNLWDNPLHSLEAESPILVSGSLQVLDIRYTGLTYLNITNFDDIPSMRHLYLSFDPPQIPFISNITSFSIFEVSQNKRKCDLKVILISESSKGKNSVECYKKRTSQLTREQSDILSSKDVSYIDQNSVKVCHTDDESNEFKFICMQKNLSTIPIFNTSVEILDLNSNNIMQLFEDSFQPSSSLKEINLSNNNLTKLSVRTFKRLPSLTDVDLSSNHLDYIHSHTFYYNKNLKKLWLQENNLHFMDMESPLLVSQSLWVLDLRFCDFTNFSIKHFDYLFSFRTLYLSSHSSHKPYISNITDFYTLVVRGKHKRMQCDLEVISENEISGKKVTECWNYKVNGQLTTGQIQTTTQDQEITMSTENIQTTAQDQEEIIPSENFSEEMVTQQPTEIMTTSDNVDESSGNTMLICIISSISFVCLITCLVILQWKYSCFTSLYRSLFGGNQGSGNIEETANAQLITGINNERLGVTSDGYSQLEDHSSARE